jgi:hypothetical protein
MVAVDRVVARVDFDKIVDQHHLNDAVDVDGL